MQPIITSNRKPLRHALLCTLLVGIVALLAVPGSARAQLYVSQYGYGESVAEYNSITGGAIKPNFITGLVPCAIALSDNTLFMANQTGGTVGKYNAATGDAINANFITGLNFPTAIALSGNKLFVANSESSWGGTVDEYNATTGAAINANFITGVEGPVAIALSGNKLFVANYGGGGAVGRIGEYNATTGFAIN
jgi:hypothetical protein